MQYSSFLPQLLLISSALAHPFEGLSLFRRQATVPRALSQAEQNSYTPHAHFASAAYCRQDLVRSWSCGTDCQVSSPNFTFFAAGGDNSATVPYYIGFDPRDLTMTGSTDGTGTIIVSHQGTPNNSRPLELDLIKVSPKGLSPLFQNVPSAVRVHAGFADLHAGTALAILNSVQSAMTKFNTKKVLVTGHSLGGALSVLSAVQLQQNLPNGTIVSSISFASPRVGNTAFANFAGNIVNVIRHVNNMDDFIPVIPGRTSSDFSNAFVLQVVETVGLAYLGGNDYAGQKGEVHIAANGTWYDCGAVHDNTSPLCSTGAVTTIPRTNFFGGSSLLDAPINIAALALGTVPLIPPVHTGPYNGVLMGQTCPINPPLIV